MSILALLLLLWLAPTLIFMAVASLAVPGLVARRWPPRVLADVEIDGVGEIAR